jgi:hypothetical protein
MTSGTTICQTLKIIGFGDHREPGQTDVDFRAALLVMIRKSTDDARRRFESGRPHPIIAGTKYDPTSENYEPDDEP